MAKKVIEDTISATSKGTFTLPVEMRRQWGITERGAKLTIRFYPDRGEAVISKPITFEEIQKMTSKHLARKRTPLSDVSNFYRSRGKK